MTRASATQFSSRRAWKNLGSTASYIAAFFATTLPISISFHQLPPIPLDPASYDSPDALTSDLVNLNNVHVRVALTSTLRSLIIDLFCYPALEIAAHLGIPAYNFFTSNASCLALYLNLPSIYRNTTENFKDVDTVFHVPCLPPTLLNHLPDTTLLKNTIECDFLINCTAHLAKSAGNIINTFETLEPKAVKALSLGFSIPDGPNQTQTPPIFCVGPLIDTHRSIDGNSFWIREKRPKVLVGGGGVGHDSVGGFVTHCGWNSVLESICTGVPMVAWLLYAEQKLNKILLLKELKLALPVNESENGLVRAEEVEKRVRELMETE
ncbi:UDP-glycosyltransferase 88A1 [Gossypium australe]|uniref:UDP-glycosyltransferase 88A1 n=1 Tax=Gossypium australe TaxID=47621 RepID=A0A5B6UMJ5_9ROSI|nr:UDP-glycosyltransferase 88A1 [Gossypium australe]